MIFLTANKQDVTLPILDWLDNNGIWRVFEDAKAGRTQNTLFYISGRHGLHHRDILKVINRCNLSDLDFIDFDIFTTGETGTILQNSELLAPIRSFTIVIEELLNAVDSLYCLSCGEENSRDKMLQAFKNSELENEVNLDFYGEEGLFIIIKALLWAMNDALVNNKVFIYTQYTE